MNGWSKQSESENVALFVGAIGLMFTIVGFSTTQPEMFSIGFLVMCISLFAFLFFNARRTKAQRKDKGD